MHLDETEKAYIAGFMDGEGSISLGKDYPRVNGHKTKIQYNLVVSMCNTNKEIVEWFKQELGGSITIRKWTKGKNHKQAYQWNLKSNQAIDFLKEILSYLKIKKQQAELAIEFQKHKREIVNQKLWIKSQIKGGHTLSDKELQYREDIWLKMRELNQRGITSIN